MTPFRVCVADPAWAFDDKLPGGRGADTHYRCLKTEDLYFLDLPPIADDAILFLWRVASMQQEALNVAHMWGFTQKSEIVWEKTKKGSTIEELEDEADLSFGMGRTVRGAHETALICTRGKYSKLIKNRSIRSTFCAPRLEHSEKPDKFYQIVEELTGGEGPYLDLFARKERPGWVSYGDEIGKPLTVAGNAPRKTA